jgi:hypothetical protein
VAQDNVFGVGDVFVSAIRTVVGEGSTSVTHPYQSGPTVVGRPATRDVVLPIPLSVQNGDYVLELSLCDYVRNKLVVSASNLTQHGFPSKLSVVGSTYTSRLQSLVATSPTPVDGTKGTVSISFNATVTLGPLVLSDICSSLPKRCQIPSTICFSQPSSMDKPRLPSQRPLIDPSMALLTSTGSGD